jgi:murein DD-endopeptidase MepM/ murein hydrolase activator NlpD
MAAPDTRVSALPGLRPLGAHPAAQDDPARVSELAHQFESLFIAQMLRQMRKSMALAGDEGEENDQTFSAMTDTIDSKLAEQLSAAGGIGIADVIIQSFDRQREAAATAPESVGGHLRSLAPPVQAPRPLADAPVRLPLAVEGAGAERSGADRTAVPLPIDQHITSAFGWRPDPFTGESTFHKGVDVRAAYGQPVPVVADGRVVSAGPAGGYGLMVVVEHGSGIQTRYAHLSELDVHAGDRVSEGQDVGRVGQTGRSTGPHLHFEILADGRPVDPMQAAARFRILAELKPMGSDADSPIGRTLTGSATEE